nr:E-beta-farnesene synthase [Tanacetum cinerariifolium]
TMADVNGNAPAGQAPTMTPPVHTLREALQITPVNNNQAFISPPSSDALINFVNELRYPKLVRNLSNVVTNDMFQPWRALTTIINLCLMKKTSGFEKPRAFVLQILWGRKHKLHPRPESPLHLPNEEPVLGYLKFSAKGIKREVFGIRIPGSLITEDIQEASYYQEYLAKVAKHRRYLAGEIGSDPDSPAPKPTKTARKPKPTAPKEHPRPSVSKPVSSTQPEPTFAPAKPQGKKRKLTIEVSNKPSTAIKSRHGFVSKKRKPISTSRYVDESVAEDVPEKEPQVGDEAADMQWALEESMNSMYDVPRGPLPPVVIREHESEKYQPLPEVPGKGKAKVTEEQVAHDLLSLQKPKKKSPVDQYIFQRRTSTPTGSSGHDESSPLYDELGQSDSEEESEEVVPEADAGGQGEGQARLDPGTQAEGQAGLNPGAEDEDREHMDLDVADVSPQPPHEQMDEGFTASAYPKVQENLKLTVEEHVPLEEPASSSGTLSSLQHLSKDLSFGDLFFRDKPSEADNDKATAETEVESMVTVTIQQDMSSILPITSPIIDLTSRPESPKVHQQLKATATKTTKTTTTSLPPPYQQQQSTTDAMMMKRIGDLEHIMANLIQKNKKLEQRLENHGVRLYTLEQLDIPRQVSKAVNEVVMDAVDWAMQAPLRNRFRDLPEADMKEILHQRMWETNSYKSHEDHMHIYEALEKSMNRDHSEELAKDLAEARKRKKKSRESPKMPPGSPPHQLPPPPPPAGPSGASRFFGASGSSQVPPPPPPPPSTNQEGPSKGSAAPSSSKTAALADYQAWMTTNIRLKPSISLTLADLQMDEDMAPDEQAQSSDDEDIGKPAWSIPSSDVPAPTNNWASALASNYSPPPEDSLLTQTGDIAMFIDWFCKRRGITKLKPQDLEGPAFEIVKVFHPDVIQLKYQMEECHKLLTDSIDDSILRHNVSKPLPLGGPPGQVTIQSDFFFNKYLEYLRYSSKGSRPALSISKMKATYYPDVGLDQMVPDQIWIDEECKHTSEGDRSAIRIHMRILSVVRIEVFSMYGYDYMKKIVLRRTDLNEQVVVERDFEYLYPSNFEDLYMLNLQGYLNHVPPKDRKILTTAVNQWTRHLVIQKRVEDFQLGIESYQT